MTSTFHLIAPDIAAATFAGVANFCIKDNRDGDMALELVKMLPVACAIVEQPTALAALERERPDAMQRYVKHVLQSVALHPVTQDLLDPGLLPQLVLYATQRAACAAPDALLSRR